MHPSFSLVMLATAAFTLEAPQEPPSSKSYKVPEFVYAQGDRSVVIEGTSARAVSELVAPDLSGQTKSFGYIVSANFLTDEFSLFLQPPVSLVLTSPEGSATDRSLSWQTAPDATFASGYRLRAFSAPDRSGQPVKTVEIPSNAATGGNIVVNAGEVFYVDVVAYRGTSVASPPGRMVKVAVTSNQSLGDGNGDGFVDGRDLMDALAAMGSTVGTEGWNPAVDVNGDKAITNSDVKAIAESMGRRS